MELTCHKLFLAVTAIRIRVRGASAGLVEEIIKICADAQEGLSLEDKAMCRHFDILHVDGKPVLEIEIRAVEELSKPALKSKDPPS